MTSRLRGTLMAAALAALTLSPAAAPATPLPGDVNGDGHVTVADAVLALRLALGLPVPATGVNAGAAHVASSANSPVTVADAAAILGLSIGLDGPSTDPPATFSLQSARLFTYSASRGRNPETIEFLDEGVKQGGVAYTSVSRTPDGVSGALLRLDSDGNVRQLVDNLETLRLKLNVAVGETWTFNAGSTAKATLVSRNATLDTPAGHFSGLLQFDFFVGPDAGWTEWVDPKAGTWVGYTRNTIAGPIDYRLARSGFFPPPLLPPASERAPYLQGGSVRATLPPLASPIVTVQIDIQGYLPDPSWAFERADVAVMGHTITVTPLIQQVKLGPTIQVLVPFQATVYARPLESGQTYTVTVVGYDRDLSTTIMTQ